MWRDSALTRLRYSGHLGAFGCNLKVHLCAEGGAGLAPSSEQRARRYEDARKRYVGGAPPVECPIAFDANARGLGIDVEKRERSVPRSADARRDEQQIGSASCRERVCQYV